MKRFFQQYGRKFHQNHLNFGIFTATAAATASGLFGYSTVLADGNDTNTNTNNNNSKHYSWWNSKNSNKGKPQTQKQTQTQTQDQTQQSQQQQSPQSPPNTQQQQQQQQQQHRRTMMEAQRTVVNTEQARRRWRQIKLFSGTANSPLALNICNELGIPCSDVEIKRFADGEIGIQILENVRGKDVFIVQPTCPPGVNDNLMELILMISTMRRASANSITAVLPYYGYARQDRKMASRVPISAADVARLLESVGVDRVIAVDLHCGQIQGFFGPRTPCDNLDGSVVALPYFKELGLTGDKTVVVSPDAGGVYRAKKFRDGLKAMDIDASLAMIVKQRAKANEIAQMDLVGDVKDMDCIIVDDMIDTAGTLCKAGKELKDRGARRIFAFATHGLFNGPAISRIASSEFEKVVVCDTVPLRDTCNKIEQLSIASLLAKAIYSVHFKESISELFNIEQGKKLPHTQPIDHNSAPSSDWED